MNDPSQKRAHGEIYTTEVRDISPGTPEEGWIAAGKGMSVREALRPLSGRELIFPRRHSWMNRG